MKAISVRQPWASLIADGKKTIELRTWRTLYRGPLLVCASANPQGDGPKGVALAVVDLIDIRAASAADAQSACLMPSDGHYAWILGNIRRIEPFPVKGRLSLFEVSVDF